MVKKNQKKPKKKTSSTEKEKKTEKDEDALRIKKAKKLSGQISDKNAGDKEKKENKESSPEENIFEIKLERMIDLIESINDDIKQLKSEAKVSYYDAFEALYEAEGDIEIARKFLSGELDNSIDTKHLIFENSTWVKLEYIVESTSCSFSEAFRALVKHNEDEFSAAQSIRDKKEN